MRHVAEDGENDETGEDARATVDAGEDQTVPEKKKITNKMNERCFYSF